MMCNLHLPIHPFIQVKIHSKTRWDETVFNGIIKFYTLNAVMGKFL